MSRVGLLACYAGLLASATTPHLSSTLSLRAAAEDSQKSSLSTKLFVSSQETPQAAPTANDKTGGELYMQTSE